MNTPLENLEAGSSVLIEYKLKADGPVVSSTSFALERDTIDSKLMTLSMTGNDSSSLQIEVLISRKPREINLQQLLLS
jgi:hypothetical protein